MIFVLAQSGGIPWADLSPVVAVGLIFLIVLLALLRHNASREKLMSEAIDRQTITTAAAMDRQVVATDKNTEATELMGRFLAVQSIGMDTLVRIVAKPKGVSGDEIMKEARAAVEAKLGPMGGHR